MYNYPSKAGSKARETRPWMRGRRTRRALSILGLLLALLSPLALLAPRASRAGVALPERHTSTISTNWTSYYPDIMKIEAISADDAWALGNYGQILHYTGGVWEALDNPIMRSDYLRDISMYSATGGWVAASHRAFHYDGTSWVERSNGLAYGGNSIDRIVALGANDVWAIGSVPSGRAFLHWDGTQWSPAGPTLHPDAFMSSVAMVSPTEGWATGEIYVEPNFIGTLYRYDGTSWQEVSNPAGMATVYGVWTDAHTPGRAWLSTGDFDHPGRVYSYNNGTWTPHPTPGEAIPGRIYMQSENEGWATILGADSYGVMHWNGSSWSIEYTDELGIETVAGADGRLWAGGENGIIVTRAASGNWNRVWGAPTGGALNAVQTLRANDAWAVGAGGAIAHFDGSEWEAVASGTDGSLNDLQMLSSNLGYAVGDFVILKWNGTQWTTDSITAFPLFGVSMTSPGNGWAVGFFEGFSGYVTTLHRAVNGVWEDVPNSFNYPLFDVAMDSPDHGWAVGGDTLSFTDMHPVLLEYTGGQWVDRSSTLPPNTPALLEIVLAPGSQQGWAAGFSRTGGRSLIRLNNGVWTIDETSPIYGLGGISVLNSQDIWGIGIFGFHYDGTGWEEVPLPTFNPMGGISIIPGYGGWAVGGEGTILRYNASTDPPTPTNTPGPPTNTPVPPTNTAVPPTNTPVSSTNTPVPATNTPVVPTATATTVPCGISFSDVVPTDYFYEPVRYLFCAGVISGYADNTFRPYNSTTRGQLAKIVVLAEGFPIDTENGPHFRDVLSTDPFYGYVETAYNRGIISGYNCGSGCLEYRPGNNVTRAQLCKIVVLAEGWQVANPPNPTFLDVPAADPFYTSIETAYDHGIISGYADNTFRPGNSATRGQIAKIVHSAITQP